MHACVCVGGRLNTIWIDTFERSCMFVCVYIGSVYNSDQLLFFHFSELLKRPPQTQVEGKRWAMRLLFSDFEGLSTNSFHLTSLHAFT